MNWTDKLKQVSFRPAFHRTLYFNHLRVEKKLGCAVPECDDLRRHRSHGQPVVSGQAEVGDLDAALVRHQQIRHLEVAVHDEVGMQVPAVASSGRELCEICKQRFL